MENSFQDITGLSHKEWNDALDDYLYRNKAIAEVHERMSSRQKDIINEIKKSFKRIKNYE